MRFSFLLVSVLSLSVLCAAPAVAAPVDLRPVESAQQKRPLLVVPPLRCGACVATVVTGAAVYGVSYLASMVLMANAATRVLAQPLDPSELGFVHNFFVDLEAGSTLVIAVPVIGPMVGTLYFKDDPAMQTLAWLDAGTQVIGLTAMVVSAVMNAASERSAHEAAMKINVVPLVKPGVSGMAVGGSF